MPLSPELLTIEQHNEVVRDLGRPGGPVEKDLRLLTSVAKIWQPSDVLPDSTREDWFDEVTKLRKGSSGLSDSVLVVLVGNAVTEEGIPAYMSWLNRVEPIKDQTGADQTPWAKWIRWWTAEEKRHDTVLNIYLYLCGRVNMPSVHRTVQNLIRNGFDSGVGDDPYRAFTYTAFQEGATRLSHLRVGRLAREQGDEVLHRIGTNTASDEGRHETFYTNRMRDIFIEDPVGAVIAFRNMLAQEVVMPAGSMDDEGTVLSIARKSPLFQRFADVAHSIGVYTASDYVDLTKGLIKTWGVTSLSVSGEAAKAQDELGKFTEPTYGARLNRIRERSMKNKPDPRFSWIYDRQVPLKRAT